jgi:TPR repeat protein
MHKSSLALFLALCAGSLPHVALAQTAEANESIPAIAVEGTDLSVVDAASDKDALRVAMAILDAGVSGSASDDEKAARLMIETMSGAPDFHAWMNLAAAREKGVGGEVDLKGAFDAYVEAAADGAPWATYNLARIHRDGAGVPRNPDAALAQFAIAAESVPAVRAAALRDLARGHLKGDFGASSNPGTAIAIIEDAISANDFDVAQVAIFLPETDKDGRDATLEDLRGEAIAMAETAAASGDARAARALFDYWHNRAPWNPEMEAKLSDLIEASGALLDPALLLRHDIAARAKTASSADEIAGLVADLETLASPAYAAGLLDVQRVNKTAYTAALQSALARAGFDVGATDGVLGRRTIRAFNAFCEARSIEDDCLTGPLSWTAALALGVEAR